MELGYAGVYRVSPDLSDITLLIDDYVGPNGLCFSPGESILYVNDSRVGLIKAWDVRPDGNIENGRLLCVLADERPGVPDGMKCDLEGNIYVTGPGGVWILAPDGRHLGTIALGDGKRATNVGFGGGDWRTPLHHHLRGTLPRPGQHPGRARTPRHLNPTTVTCRGDVKVAPAPFNLRPRSVGPGLSPGANVVRHLLANHDRGGVGVRPDAVRHDGRVGHADVLQPVDPALLVHHGHAVAGRPHLARPRNVVRRA